MTPLARLATAAIALGLTTFHLAAAADSSARPSTGHTPTVILVHGAFAESSSWDAVTARLHARHLPVIAAANPLRGLKDDATFVSAIVGSVDGPVVLVGHSYGGSVISAAAQGQPNVKALVFVAAFAPDEGESAFDLSARFPGSTLGEALAPPVMLADGAKDLYIRQKEFSDQFAADLPREVAALMAVSQRPVTEAALGEGAPGAAWKSVPSWFIYGDGDRNIPPAALAFMAERAKSRKTIVVRGASHVVMMSNPDIVAGLIAEAAQTATARP